MNPQPQLTPQPTRPGKRAKTIQLVWKGPDGQPAQAGQPSDVPDPKRVRVFLGYIMRWKMRQLAERASQNGQQNGKVVTNA